MSFYVFNKMLARNTALIIFILYKQVESFHLNGNNNSPNLVLNKTFSFNSQGNGLRSRLGQLSQNQQNNLQQSDNKNLAKNFKQAFNLQTANLQNANAQQSLNLQQAKLQPSLTSNIIQESAMLQQPVTVQQGANNVYPSHLQQNINLQPQNQNAGNIQILRQANDVPNALFSQTYGVVNPTANSGITSSQANLYNANSPSDVMSLVMPQQQVSYTSATPNEFVSVVCPQNQQVSSYTHTTPSEVLSTVCPQSQQLLYSSGTPYVIDTSQVTNNIPATIGSQPPLVTILAGPQQNQQSYVAQSPIVSNPAELQNQITIIKSVQPQPYTPGQLAPNQDHLVNMVYPSGPEFPLPITETAPSINSILTSALTKQVSKSSNMKALLPLIFNLIKERNNNNNCGCHNQCGCQNNSPRMPEGGEEMNDGCSRQCDTCGNQNYKSDHNFKYTNDYSEDDFEDSYDKWRNNKRFVKRKKVRPSSVEYDYSDELQE